MFTKGADSVMLPRINFHFEENENFEGRVQEDLESFAREGLRVLLIGGKKLEVDEYREYKKELDRILVLKGDERDTKLNQLYSSLEKNLKYIGSTAIEDKLQEGV